VEPVPEAALRSADEVLLAFATRGVLPVTTLDGAPVGTGRPGPVWQRLHAAFEAYVAEVAALPAL
jgi:D-alanine transaminase